MKISDAAEVLGAVLLTRPSISAFVSVASKVERVQNSCLFIAQNAAQIPAAIDAGAYAILSDLDIEGVVQLFASSTDVESLRQKIDEVAFYQTPNLKDSLIRLIRFELLAKKISLILFSPVEFEIAKNIAEDDEVLFFDGDFFELAEAIFAKNYRAIFVKNEQLLCVSLEPIRSIVPEVLPFELMVANLFDIKIFYKGSVIELNLPRLFLGELGAVLNMFQSENVAFSLQNFTQIPHLKPYFITPTGRIGKHGQSEKVLIIEENIADFKRYMGYISSHARWGKMLFIMPTAYTEVFENIAPTLGFKEKDEVVKFIKRENYNFALVFGVSADFVLEALSQPVKEPSLFDGLFDDS